jgi:hypothetical protein
MSEDNNKIGYKDLTFWLKVAVVGGNLYILNIILSFIYGFILGFMGVY